MDNKNVAKLFDELAKLMELNGENPFKIRSYQSAYQTIRSLEQRILDMSPDEIKDISGIGNAIALKLEEIKETSTFNTLERNREEIPFGIREMLGIKGVGVKKIRAFWKELHLDTPEQVINAALTNQLISLKGISDKTQAKILEQLELFVDSRGKKLCFEAQLLSDEIIALLKLYFPEKIINLVGDVKAYAPVVDKIEFVTDIHLDEIEKFLMSIVPDYEIESTSEMISFVDEIKYVFHYAESNNLWKEVFVRSSSSELIDYIEKEIVIPNFKDEKEWMNSLGWSYLPPETRHSLDNLTLAKNQYNFDLIEEIDIKGMVHFHTNYSDGLNTLEEMISATIEKGYKYAVVTDHSKSAFYASGLEERRVMNQFDEIKIVQAKYPQIKILRSIESDILSSGALDYQDEMLSQFDLIIASVHSNLNMTEEKAMKRLLKAIENPYTHILGHMTSRLLLMRNGYPLDHQIIIDACAANNVSIELNCNPRRMDIDYSWIRLAINKGVMISINPDAHFVAGIDDIKYGVQVARRGGLSKSFCLNALPVDEFLEKLKK